MRALTKVILITAFIFIYLPSLTPAQSSGDLDTTFGIGGKVTTDIFGYLECAHSLVLQDDGKIIIAGYSQNFSSSYREITLVRYLSDGNIDISFGTNGIVITDVSNRGAEAKSIVIQSDDKVVVAGFSDSWSPSSNGDAFTVVRYDNNGTPDNTFGTNGVVRTEISDENDVAESVVIQPDGKLVVVGWTNYSDIVLVKYNSDGSLDNSFGSGGIVITDINSNTDQGKSVALQTDGKIIVTGYSILPFPYGFYRIFVARYNSNGDLDLSFGTNGIVITTIGDFIDDARGYDIYFQPDGKILVAGYYGDRGPNIDHFALLRYNSDGSLDNSFGVNGITVTAMDGYTYAESIDLDYNGDIFLGGTSDDNFALAKYDSDGNIDVSFGASGIVTTDFSGHLDFGHSLKILADNKIILAGESYTVYSDFALARYLNSDIISVGLIDFRCEVIGPLTFTLEQNYPNPFNPNTLIKYQIPELSFVTLKVYDVLGNEIAILINEEKPTGTYEVELNGIDLPSGVYFYQIQAGNFVETKKMVLMK